MHNAVRMPAKVLTFLATCALLITVCVSVSPFAYAENSVSVQNDAELIQALADGNEKILIEYDSPSLPQDLTISSSVSIDGGGAQMELGACSITVEASGKLTLSNISLVSESEYAIRSSGALEFDSAVSFGGIGGVLAESGTVSGGGYTLIFSEGIDDAFHVAGSAVFENVYIWHFGQGAGVRLLSSSTLTAKGITTVISESGDGIVNDDQYSPGLTAAPAAQMKILAQTEGCTGIALREGKLTVSDSAQITVSSGGDAVVCKAVDAAGKTTLEIEGDNGLVLTGDFTVSTSGTVTVTAKKDGVIADKISFGSSLSLDISAGERAIKCSNMRTASDSYVNISAKHGIISSGSVGFGEKNDVTIDSSEKYCIYSDSADGDIDFASDCTAELKSDGCAIYSKGSVTFSVGSDISITGGQYSPAVVIDSTKAKFNISGAKVDIISFVSAKADINCAVYVTGPVNIDNGAEVNVTAYEQFAVIIKSGKLSIMAGSNLFASGGCAVYGEKSDVALSAGSGLFAHGTVDSGIRLTAGSLTVGDSCELFAQGDRFGVELLESGSLAMASCGDYTIRSVNFNALYIENGSFLVGNIDRISVYGKSVDDNIGLWCSDYSQDAPAWENPCDIYADNSLLNPNAEQKFIAGIAVQCDALNFNDSPWSISDYSCITRFTTRPVARPNQFNIPSGKTYSWKLYGYSYLGSGVTYELDNVSCDGELHLSSDGKLTYTAHSSTRGVQTFTYTVRDSEGIESAPAAVDILVSASKPPIAWNMNFDTGIDEQLIGNVTTRDYDGTISQVVLVSEPQHGDFIMGADGTFIYTPHGQYSGIDTFSYYAVDAVGDESTVATATIFVGMSNIHQSRNMTIITLRDSQVNTALDILLVQPEPKDDEPYEPAEIAELIIGNQPEYGTLTLNEDNSISYEPFSGFAGTDSFTYKFTSGDDFESNEATVTIAIVPGQQPDAYGDTRLICTGRKMTFELNADDLDGVIAGYTVVDQPQHGMLSVDGDTGTVVYTPDKGYIGKDSFTFSVIDDEELSSDIAVVELQVTGLFDYLKQSNMLVDAILIITGILAVIAALVLVPVFVSKRRKRDMAYYEELERELYHDDFGDF